MSSVWEVMKAVRASTMPAPSRHIVMTLASLADVETGVVPERYAPSITDLVKMTGLGRSTVTEHLNAVEDSKWVERDRPSAYDARVNKATTQYRVCVGVSPAGGLGQGADQPNGAHQDNTDDGLGRQADQPDQPKSDITADELVQEADQASPPGGREVPTKNSPKSKPSTSAKKPKVPKPPREDVERLCLHLADWIERNGSKRPEIGQKWRDECRRMLDIDKRTEAQVVAAIDWCQRDDFWLGNIESMPTLRRQYDRLRLAAVAKAKKDHAAAERERSRSPNSNAPTAIGRDEACPKHEFERATTCGACASERKGRPQ